MSPRPGPVPTVFYLLVFALALFINSAVLWLVEPLILRYVLLMHTSSGGGAVACLVFFQGALLAGCAYAHLSVRLLGPRKQAVGHVVLLALPLLGALAQGGLGPTVAWDWAMARGNAHEAFLQVMVVLLLAGAPAYFVLGASVPLLQRWFADSGHPECNDPYFLYGVAALGGMAAVLGYPLLVEPALELRTQSACWGYGYAFAAALSLFAAVLLWLSPAAFGRPGPQATSPPETAAPPVGYSLRAAPGLLRRLRWLALAAVPFSLVAGQTTYITTDISAIPLFWTVPLLLFLCARVLAFTRQPLLSLLPRNAMLALQWAHALAIMLPIVALFLLQQPTGQPPSPWIAPLLTVLAPLILLMPQSWVVVAQPFLTVALILGMFAPVPLLSGLPLHLVVLYLGARLCLGELVKDRPPAQELTGYYLWIATGAALGGLFNAVLAPLLFPESAPEYLLALVLVCLLRPARTADGFVDRLAMLIVGAPGQAASTASQLRRRTATAVCCWLWLLLVGTCAALIRLRMREFGDPPGRGAMSPREVLLPLRDAIIAYGVPLLLCLIVAARPLWFGLSLGMFLLVAPNNAAVNAGGVDILGGLPSAAVERVGFTLLLTPLAVAALVVIVGLVSGGAVALSGAGERRGVSPP